MQNDSRGFCGEVRWGNRALKLFLTRNENNEVSLAVLFGRVYRSGLHMQRVHPPRDEFSAAVRGLFIAPLLSFSVASFRPGAHHFADTAFKDSGVQTRPEYFVTPIKRSTMFDTMLLPFVRQRPVQ